MWAMRLAAAAAALGSAACVRLGPGSPAGVPADVDCAIRKYAWEYGKQRLPRQGSFVSLFDALQLGENCGVARPEETAVAPPAFPAGAAALFVDAAGGDDAAGGTARAPLRTIAAGAAKAAALLRDGVEGVTLNLRAGTHYLADTVHLGPEHNGLTIQNCAGEDAVVSGGVPFSIAPAAWTPHRQRVYWDVQGSANNVYGGAVSRGNTTTIKYLGDFDTASACRKAAAAGPYRSYTHHSPEFPNNFAKQCFGRTDAVWAVHAQGAAESGFLVEQNVWKAPVDASVNITAMPGLRVEGARAIRGKYPNGDPEQSGHFLKGFNQGMGGGDYVEGWVPLSAQTAWVPPRRKPDAQEVVVNAADWPGVEWPMREAGGSPWNGEGDWGDFHAGWGGYCDDLSPPFGYWCAMHPPRGQCWNKTTNVGRGCTQTHMSPDGMVFPRAAARNYSNPVGAVVNAWRGGGRWFTQQWRVDGWDKAANVLTFDPATGQQGGEGMTAGGQYWIENVLEEVDSAREYYFDEAERVLYYQPNNTRGDASPPAAAAFVATKHRVLFNISGAFPHAPVRNVTIRGLTMRDTRYTYLDAHGMPSGGDWALPRSGAVVVDSAEDVTIASNAFTKIDGNGVSINGYIRNLTIAENDFSWIGDGAMAAWGHTSECLNANCSKRLPAKVGPDGRGGEQPRGVRVVRNLVREIGIWQKQSSFWFQAITAQTLLEDNVHFNGPRAGVNFNDGFGGGDVMTGNLLVNCVRESGDHGPVNTWDRLPYITDIKTGKPSVIPEWRELTKNFIIGTYASQSAVDNDDGSAYYKTHANAFVYAGAGLKSDFGGHDNRHFDNVYAWPTNCFGSQIGFTGGNADHFVNNTCIANSDTGGFAKSDCAKAIPPLEVVTGNGVYNKNGTSHVEFCDKTNRILGTWPSAAEAVRMLQQILA